jgi:HEAT repeat protein
MRWITRVIGLRPGEGGPVGLTVSASFFASAGLMIGGSGIEALFFARYGVSKLPVMYLVLGGTMFVLTVGFGALLGRVGRGKACLAVPAVLAVIAAIGRIALAADIGWITQALWLLQGAAQFLVSLSVWGLAGIVTDTRQAKRFFPLIGAGGVLGFVIGGLATKPLASAIGAPNLLLVWIATLVIVLVIGARLLALGDHGVSRRRSDRVGPIDGLVRGWRYARGSTLMRWLAVGSVMFSLLFFSLYLPFSRAATEHYPDPDQLAGFFGVFFGLATGAAFLLSLLVTNRLLARFGVPTVLLVLPLLYLVAFGVLTVEASFVLLAAFRFGQVAWMSGGASSSWEAVINTVPADRRDQIRAFLYGGPTQVGTVLAGVIALVGERSLSPRTLAAVGFVCAAIAVAAMIGVRRAYPRELVAALREGRPHVFDAAPAGSEPFGVTPGVTPAERSAIETAAAALADPDPGVRRVAARVLGDLDPAEAREPLLACLRDGDADVRATAVASLAGGDDDEMLPMIVGLADDADASVRLAVVAAAASVGRGNELATTTIRRSIEDPDPFVRSSAAGALIARGDDLEALSLLIELAGSAVEQDRVAAFGAMGGLADPALIDAAEAGMADSAAAVRAEAAGAMATLDPSRALTPLVAALADEHPSVREAAAAALGILGEPALAPVIDSLASSERRDGALMALEHLPIDRWEDPVHSFAVSMVEGSVESYRLGAAVQGDADNSLTLLRDSLIGRSERQAILGLRGAALLGGRNELSVAIENLSVTDPSQRANALEVIESVGMRDVVKPLLSMWDGTPERIDRDTLLQRLRDDPDEWLRACVELANQHPPDTDTEPPGGPMARTMQTLSPMERVLFLRGVSLFAALPPQDLPPIAAIATEHAYEDGDTIAVQGEPGDELHIIVSGDVAVSMRDGAGDERVVAVRSPGEAIGEMAVITDEPRVATLLARGKVRVLTIAKPQFEAILRERPDTAIGVIHVLSRRLASASG